MGAGIFLLVIGALLTFAVQDHVRAINLPVAGVILMLAGVAVLYLAKTAEDSEKTTTIRETTEDDDDDGAGGHGPTTHVVEETVREHHPE